jgi:hypothetical protein
LRSALLYSLRDRKHRINVKQKADVGFPLSTQPRRYAIAQRLGDNWFQSLIGILVDFNENWVELHEEASQLSIPDRDFS